MIYMGIEYLCIFCGRVQFCTCERMIYIIFLMEITKS